MNMTSILLQAGSGSPMMSLLPLILIFVVFYFFMIRPQMKRQKELKTYRDSLQKGDRVVTTGGLYGKVTEVSDQTVHMEISPNVHVKVDKYAVLKDASDLTVQK